MKLSECPPEDALGRYAAGALSAAEGLVLVGERPGAELEARAVREVHLEGRAVLGARRPRGQEYQRY
ncbi:MAG: hypothetical protein AAB289_16375, partial [Chloroflexota bacterium]